MLHSGHLEKHFNPLSLVCHGCRKSTQHIRTLNLPWESTVRYEQPTDLHTQLYSPPYPHQHATSPPTITAQTEHQESAHPQPPSRQLTPNNSGSRTTALAYNCLFFRTTALKHLKVLYKTTRIFKKQFISCMLKKIPKQETLHCPTLNTLPPTYTKTK